MRARSLREPATELEAAVLAIVHGLLGNESVGLDDDFFLSGGPLAAGCAAGDADSRELWR